jgi:hypothetical protein
MEELFSQLWSVHGVSEVRQTEIHTAESLVLEPSTFEIETVIEKLKRHQSPGTDQIPAKFIKAGGKTIRSAIHKLIICIWNKEELPEQWKELITIQIVVIIKAYLYIQNSIQHLSVKVNSI